MQKPTRSFTQRFYASSGTGASSRPPRSDGCRAGQTAARPGRPGKHVTGQVIGNEPVFPQEGEESLEVMSGMLNLVDSRGVDKFRWNCALLGMEG